MHVTHVTTTCNIQMSLVCASTWIHDHVYGLCCHQWPYDTWGHVDVFGLSCCWQLWWCLWSLQWQQAITVSMVLTDTEHHAENCGMFWHQSSCIFHGLCCLPETMCTSMIHVPTCKGQGSYFVIILMTANSQLRKRDIEGFSENTSPQMWWHLSKNRKDNSLDRKPLKNNS